MTAFLEKFLRFGDWLLVTVVLVLLGIGLIAVWSFSPPASGLFSRQLLWLAIGLTAFFVFSILDYRIFRNHGLFLVVLYGVVMVILASLLVFAPPTRGVRAWFQIGGAGVQPVELAKLVLVVVLAKYFSRRHVEIAQVRHLIISGLYVGAVVFLVLLQPDLGSALILMGTWLAVVLFAGIQPRPLLVCALLAVAFSVLTAVSALKCRSGSSTACPTALKRAVACAR